MKKSMLGMTLTLVAVVVAGCSGSTQEPLPGQAGVGAQELVFDGGCDFEGCGTVPSTLSGKPKVVCTSKSGDETTLEPGEVAACGWGAADPNEQTVSVRYCSDAECGAPPDAECPAGTVASAATQACYDEGAGCRWSLHCPAPKPGQACNTNADCDSGICEGPGCGDLEGRCVPNVGTRACTDDFRQYCSCEGETFSGSGSCPDRRYSRMEACE